MIKRIVALFAALSFTGCATMLHGSTQQFSIHSDDRDASLFVNDTYKGKGFTTFEAKKSEDYTISARKDGCQPNAVHAEKSIDPLWFGGLITAPILAIALDNLSTGAWQRFDRTDFTVNPVCPVTPAPVLGAAPVAPVQ